MKRITVSLFAILATVALVSFFVPSSYAVKALSDDEMDATTAKGQSAIEKDDGDQTLTDESSYDLRVKENAQETLVAGDSVNAVGENNVVSAVNASSGGSALEQHIDISQSKAASISSADTYDKSVANNESTTTTKSSTYTESKTWSFAETFPPTTINLSPTISTTGNGDATATSAGNATATSTANNTGSYTGNQNSDGYSHATAESEGLSAPGGTDGESSRHGQRYEIQANVQHKQDNYTTDYQTYETAVIGNDAAVSKATANSDNQANAVGIAKTLTEVDIKLPKAKSGSGTFDSSSTCDYATHSESSTICTESSTHSKSIVADHIESGDGDQTITDASTWSVCLSGYAQNDATILNSLNIAGRNNAVTAWNIAADVNGQVSGLAGSGNVLQTITVSQVN